MIFLKSPDCSNTIFFLHEVSNSPGRLWTLNVGDRVATKIPYGGQNGWQQCEVNLNSSWYLGCDGSRLRSSQYLSKMKELFTFTGDRLFKNKFALKVRNSMHLPKFQKHRLDKILSTVWVKIPKRLKKKMKIWKYFLVDQNLGTVSSLTSHSRTVNSPY